MIKQYLKIKDQNRDKILFFRLGDFYEMFYEDAKLASEELDLTLTGRDCGKKERAPMCGVPYHSCESYIARLVEKGYKVAICEQTEDPATAKGLVNREVVRVITPGTVLEDTMLDESRNNYLCCIHAVEGRFGICFADVSTGSLLLTEAGIDSVDSFVMSEIGRFDPSELLLVEDDTLTLSLAAFAEKRMGCKVTRIKKAYFDPDAARETVKAHFGINTLEQKGLSEGSAGVSALGALLGYLGETQMSGISRMTDLNIYSGGQFMRLNITAMRNLELCETMIGKERRGSLLWVLDHTKTAMGKRLIRSWIEQPLMGVAEITARQNAVDELVSDTLLRGEVRELMTGVRDMERVMTKIVFGTAGGKELSSLAFTAARMPELKAATANCQSGILSAIHSDIDELTDVCEWINATIVDEPPFSVREGGIIREGYDRTLDILRTDMKDSKSLITRIEADEREKTGIKNLRIRYNKVFGYYIEVTNSFKDKVPPEYIRKQTLTNCERYITDELKDLEARLLGARERSWELEFEIFDGLRRRIADQLERIQKTAHAVARLDVLASLAETAVQNGYCRPALNTEGRIVIIGGRHPVVETISDQPFVPNDAMLDCAENRCAIITGPNMAGKSTYMRQVALITIMAQIGSFVPAQSADIGIVDSIFTRVGASDDLASGRSTFMVEMSEVAEIIREATPMSLIILDEIGRGTSTYDGMSIARAVLEYVASHRRLGAKTLFSTHYHELTTLEGEIDGVKNYNITAKKSGDDIIFLRKIARGGADDSYGIEVAALAGVPSALISRARKILKELESGALPAKPTEEPGMEQLPLEIEGAKAVLKELDAIDVNSLTPIEAMATLAALVERAKNL